MKLDQQKYVKAISLLEIFLCLILGFWFLKFSISPNSILSNSVFSSQLWGVSFLIIALILLIGFFIRGWILIVGQAGFTSLFAVMLLTGVLNDYARLGVPIALWFVCFGFLKFISITVSHSRQ